MAKKKGAAKVDETAKVNEKVTAAVGADPGYVASLTDGHGVSLDTEVKLKPKAKDSGVAEKVKEPDIELVDELCRYEFTDSELVDLATEIGELMHRMDRLTAEKKSAVSAFDSDLKKADLDMQTMAQLIRDRFEMRRMQCYCVKDYAGRKAYYFRADIHELEYLKTFTPENFLEKLTQLETDTADGPVKVRDLKHWELQRELEFDKDTDPGADADFVGHESLLDEDEEK